MGLKEKLPFPGFIAELDHRQQQSKQDVLIQVIRHVVLCISADNEAIEPDSILIQFFRLTTIQRQRGKADGNPPQAQPVRPVEVDSAGMPHQGMQQRLKVRALLTQAIFFDARYAALRDAGELVVDGGEVAELEPLLKQDVLCDIAPRVGVILQCMAKDGDGHVERELHQEDDKTQAVMPVQLRKKDDHGKAQSQRRRSAGLHECTRREGVPLFAGRMGRPRDDQQTTRQKRKDEGHEVDRSVQPLDMQTVKQLVPKRVKHVAKGKVMQRDHLKPDAQNIHEDGVKQRDMA